MLAGLLKIAVAKEAESWLFTRTINVEDLSRPFLGQGSYNRNVIFWCDMELTGSFDQTRESP